jgi:hypothetical protein
MSFNRFIGAAVKKLQPKGSLSKMQKVGKKVVRVVNGRIYYSDGTTAKVTDEQASFNK